jgi:hypothetical protein
MILISHRGNICGKNPEHENSPKQIEKVISLGFDVEIDVWSIGQKWFLGHDSPDTEIDISFLKNRALWCHAKNLSALKKMIDLDIHCFWHQNDDYTLTSKGYIWTYPNRKLNSRSIAVCTNYPIINLTKNMCAGICSDWIYDIRDDLKND